MSLDAVLEALGRFEATLSHLVDRVDSIESRVAALEKADPSVTDHARAAEAQPPSPRPSHSPQPAPAVVSAAAPATAPVTAAAKPVPAVSPTPATTHAPTSELGSERGSSVEPSIGYDSSVDVPPTASVKAVSSTVATLPPPSAPSRSVSSMDDFRESFSEGRWNDAFQHAVHLPRRTREEALERVVACRTSLAQLSAAAATVASQIVTELGEPSKASGAAAVGGHAGGEKYVRDGIFLKLARDSAGLYGGDSFAAKTAGLDRLHLSLVQKADSKHLSVPATTQFDIAGFRLLAMSVLPIGGETLRYGSADAGRTVHNGEADPEIASAAAELGATLNLRKHLAGVNASTAKDVWFGVDVEIHRGRDDRAYLLDGARLLPAEAPRRTITAFIIPADPLGAPQPLSTLCTHIATTDLTRSSAIADLERLLGGDIVVQSLLGATLVYRVAGSDRRNSIASFLIGFDVFDKAVLLSGERGQHLAHCLRPEAVLRHHTALSSDSFTRFGMHDAVSINAEAASATRTVVEQHVVRAATQIINGHSIPVHPTQVVKAVKACGVNVRHLGLVRGALSTELQRLAARGVDKAVEAAALGNAVKAHDMILVEMVSRTAKIQIRDYMRQALLSETSASSATGTNVLFESTPIAPVEAASPLNRALSTATKELVKILGGSPDSESWWRVQLPLFLRLKFGSHGQPLTGVERDQSFDLRWQTPYLSLAAALAEACGVAISPRWIVRVSDSLTRAETLEAVTRQDESERRERDILAGVSAAAASRKSAEVKLDDSFVRSASARAAGDVPAESDPVFSGPVLSDPRKIFDKSLRTTGIHPAPALEQAWALASQTAASLPEKSHSWSQRLVRAAQALIHSHPAIGDASVSDAIMFCARFGLHYGWTSWGDGSGLQKMYKPSTYRPAQWGARSNSRSQWLSLVAPADKGARPDLAGTFSSAESRQHLAWQVLGEAPLTEDDIEGLVIEGTPIIDDSDLLSAIRGVACGEEWDPTLASDATALNTLLAGFDAAGSSGTFVLDESFTTVSAVRWDSGGLPVVVVASVSSSDAPLTPEAAAAAATVSGESSNVFSWSEEEDTAAAAPAAAPARSVDLEPGDMRVQFLIRGETAGLFVGFTSKPFAVKGHHEKLSNSFYGYFGCSNSVDSMQAGRTHRTKGLFSPDSIVQLTLRAQTRTIEGKIIQGIPGESSKHKQLLHSICDWDRWDQAETALTTIDNVPTIPLFPSVAFADKGLFCVELLSVEGWHSQGVARSVPGRTLGQLRADAMHGTPSAAVGEAEMARARILATLESRAEQPYPMPDEERYPLASLSRYCRSVLAVFGSESDHYLHALEAFAARLAVSPPSVTAESPLDGTAVRGGLSSARQFVQQLWKFAAHRMVHLRDGPLTGVPEEASMPLSVAVSSLRIIGDAAMEEGRPAAAEGSYRKALAALTMVGGGTTMTVHPHCIVLLDRLASAVHAQGRVVHASALASAGLSLWSSIPPPVPPLAELSGDGLLALTRVFGRWDCGLWVVGSEGKHECVNADSRHVLPFAWSSSTTWFCSPLALQAWTQTLSSLGFLRSKCPIPPQPFWNVQEENAAEALAAMRRHAIVPVHPRSLSPGQIVLWDSDDYERVLTFYDGEAEGGSLLPPAHEEILLAWNALRLNRCLHVVRLAGTRPGSAPPSESCRLVDPSIGSLVRVSVPDGTTLGVIESTVESGVAVSAAAVAPSPASSGVVSAPKDQYSSEGLGTMLSHEHSGYSSEGLGAVLSHEHSGYSSEGLGAVLSGDQHAAASASGYSSEGLGAVLSGDNQVHPASESGYSAAIATSSDQGRLVGRDSNSSDRSSAPAEQIVDLATNSNVVIATTSSGRALSWGGPGYHAPLMELGIADSPETVAPLTCKELTSLTGKRITRVACGSNHTLLVSAEGALYSFGNGRHGALGHGNEANHGTPRLVTSFGRTSISRVAAGNGYSFAIASDGACFSWGHNDHGQLGLGHETTMHVPQRVTALAHPAVKVCCADSLSLLLNNQGLVLFSGRLSFSGGSGSFHVGTDSLPNRNTFGLIGAFSLRQEESSGAVLCPELDRVQSLAQRPMTRDFSLTRPSGFGALGYAADMRVRFVDMAANRWGVVAVSSDHRVFSMGNPAARGDGVLGFEMSMALAQVPLAPGRLPWKPARVHCGAAPCWFVTDRDGLGMECWGTLNSSGLDPFCVEWSSFSRTRPTSGNVSMGARCNRNRPQPVWSLHRGRVRLAVTTAHGKENTLVVTGAPTPILPDGVSWADCVLDPAGKSPPWTRLVVRNPFTGEVSDSSVSVQPPLRVVPGQPIEVIWTTPHDASLDQLVVTNSTRLLERKQTCWSTTLPPGPAGRGVVRVPIQMDSLTLGLFASSGKAPTVVNGNWPVAVQVHLQVRPAVGGPDSPGMELSAPRAINLCSMIMESESPTCGVSVTVASGPPESDWVSQFLRDAGLHLVSTFLVMPRSPLSESMCQIDCSPPESALKWVCEDTAQAVKGSCIALSERVRIDHALSADEIVWKRHSRPAVETDTPLDEAWVMPPEALRVGAALRAVEEALAGRKATDSSLLMRLQAVIPLRSCKLGVSRLAITVPSLSSGTSSKAGFLVAQRAASDTWVYLMFAGAFVLNPMSGSKWLNLTSTGTVAALDGGCVFVHLEFNPGPGTPFPPHWRELDRPAITELLAPDAFEVDLPFAFDDKGSSVLPAETADALRGLSPGETGWICWCSRDRRVRWVYPVGASSASSYGPAASAPEDLTDLWELVSKPLLVGYHADVIAAAGGKKYGCVVRAPPVGEDWTMCVAVERGDVVVCGWESAVVRARAELRSKAASAGAKELVASADPMSREGPAHEVVLQELLAEYAKMYQRQGVPEQMMGQIMQQIEDSMRPQPISTLQACIASVAAHR
jgi:hypothetical protein